MLSYGLLNKDNELHVIISGAIMEVKEMPEGAVLLEEPVQLGSRYVSGNWLPPLPPTEEELLRRELEETEWKLRQIFEEDKFNDWLDGDNRFRDTQTKEQLIARRNEILVSLMEKQAE